MIGQSRSHRIGILFELIRKGLPIFLIDNGKNKIQFVSVDELNIAIRYDYVDINEVVTFLVEEKPEMTHVVITGRNAKDDLIEIADLVTEMELLKHPFRAGIKAQIGVEY